MLMKSIWNVNAYLDWHILFRKFSSLECNFYHTRLNFFTLPSFCLSINYYLANSCSYSLAIKCHNYIRFFIIHHEFLEEINNLNWIPTFRIQWHTLIMLPVMKHRNPIYSTHQFHPKFTINNTQRVLLIFF